MYTRAKLVTVQVTLFGSPNLYAMLIVKYLHFLLCVFVTVQLVLRRYWCWLVGRSRSSIGWRLLYVRRGWLSVHWWLLAMSPRLLNVAGVRGSVLHLLLLAIRHKYRLQKYKLIENYHNMAV